MNNTNNNNEQNNDIENFQLDVTKSQKFWSLEDGVYPATFEKLILRPGLTNQKGEIFDLLVWKFRVGEQIIEGTSSAKITTMSKAFSWATAILGKEPALGNFDPKSMTGKKCQLVIKNTGSGDFAKSQIESVVKAK